VSVFDVGPLREIMTSEPYLLRLTAILADGLSRVPAVTRTVMHLT
jgi:hypothetical protein